MRRINRKCTNENSFKYSILISPHYYELNNHPERRTQFKKYISKYNFESNNYKDFENNNPSVSLNVYDEYKELLHKSNNKTNNIVKIVKINKHRYNALKPKKDKYKKLVDLLKQFTHEELKAYILNKIIQV